MVHDARIAAIRRFASLRLGVLPLAAAAVATLALAGGAVAATVPVSGGGGLVPVNQHNKIPRAPSKNAHGKWLSGVTVTEYWPSPESWFTGEEVKAPGLPGKHRIDWLYSAMGMSMQGEGIGLDGRMYHIAKLGNGGWVTASGKRTSATDGFAAGSPYWRAGGYWRTSGGAVTFPLASGGWSAGTGKHYVPCEG